MAGADMSMKAWPQQAAVWFASISATCLLLVLYAHPSGTRAKITMTYDYFDSEVAPVRAEHVSRHTETYILNPDGSIDLNYWRTITHLKFGETKYAVDAVGQNRSVTFHVKGGALVVTYDAPTHYVVFTITTNGTTSCSANIRWIHKPGERLYKNYGVISREIRYDTIERADNITCAIENIGP
jgi:hypothetical protein